MYNSISDYNILCKLNPVFDKLSYKVYEHILDPDYTDTNKCIKRETVYADETKNILLWKLRKYNQYIEYFIHHLVDIEQEYRVEITSKTKLRLTHYLSKIFIDRPLDIHLSITSTGISPFIEYMNHILQYNKLPDGNYEYLQKLKELLCVIKDIHNVISDDEGQYYMFLTRHLQNLFTILKHIVLQSNILNE